MDLRRIFLGLFIILIYLSPALEFFDQWEQFGRDPDVELLFLYAAITAGLPFTFRKALKHRLGFLTSSFVRTFANEGQPNLSVSDRFPSSATPIFLTVCDLRI